jgi:galactokinase
MGHRILEHLTGRSLEYLANVTPAEFATLEGRIPERLTGREFLDCYRSTIDRVTSMAADRVYPVRAATVHPIYEHARAREFAMRLSRCADTGARGMDSLTEDAECLGALMYESHAGYSACGLGCDATDALVTRLRAAGSDAGIYGAKITGGGCGGTVAILAHTDAASLVHAIAAQHEHRCGRAVRVFGDSSAGAAACGVYSLRV